WMQTTALMTVAYQLTGENRWPAWISAAQIFPTFLLAPWAGILADRLPKRSLIFCTQAILLLLALVLVALVQGDTHPEHLPLKLLVVTVVSGTVVAVDLPARLAFVMEMVGREDLTNAVALNAVLFNVARLTGPLFAGWLLLSLGPALCFWCNAASYLFV